jgi:2-methylcitrate dehydratase PrpD
MEINTFSWILKTSHNFIDLDHLAKSLQNRAPEEQLKMAHNQGKYRSARCVGPMLTRRSLFEFAGLAIATSALPPGLLLTAQSANQDATPQGVSPVMDKLSAYMSQASARALPIETLENAKEHILDTFAAMVSGSDLLPGLAALRFVRAYGGKKVSTVVASDILCGPIEAALTNGMLAQADETDDSHAPSHSHPGCAVIPAALAAGEQFRISGTHFLRAVTLGYDVGSRFTMTMGGASYENESHRSTHSIAPIFGAAAAAGCAAGLNPKQMRLLLGYTAQQCSGLTSWRRDTEHTQKAFVFAGMTARSGVTSALVVQSGWTGVEDILSGTDNFFQAYCPAADPAGLIDKLGERYEITQTDVKKWTVGSPIQAVLDALVILLKRRPFEADQVQRVTVRLAPREAITVNNREMPDICVQHMVAVTLLDKTATFASAHDKARMQDPAVLRQRAKVQLLPDQELERFLPTRAARVDVTLADGTQLTEEVDVVRGTAKNPMTRDEIVAKTYDLVTPILGAATCSSLLDKVLNLENVKDVRELRPVLQRK